MAPPAASLACACCGKEPEAGRKWPCCEWCARRNLPTTCYCSEACQATHWKGGHKEWHTEVERRRKECEETGAFNEDRESAEELTRQAEETGSEYDRLIAEGAAHVANSHLRYAERSFRKAIECKPTEAVAYFNLGETLSRAGDVVQASSCFLRASELILAGSEEWATSIANAFDKLKTKYCRETPKPEWWHDEALKELSARALAAAPCSAHSMQMRAHVLGGALDSWQVGPRTAAELKEAARLSWRAAESQYTYMTDQKLWIDYAAKLDMMAEQKEAVEAAAAEARAAEAKALRQEAEEKAAAELKEKEAKANAAADALLAEEAAEKAAATRSGGKAQGKGKGKKGKR